MCDALKEWWKSSLFMLFSIFFRCQNGWESDLLKEVEEEEEYLDELSELFGFTRLCNTLFSVFFLFVCLRTNQHKYIHEKISKWLNHDFNTKCYIWMHNIWLTHRKKKVLSHFHMTFYILFCLFFSYLACHRKCNVHVHMYICAAPFYHSR